MEYQNDDLLLEVGPASPTERSLNDSSQPTLSYFVVLQPGGVSLYSQSFNFADFEACHSYGGRLTDLSTNMKLLGQYFDALNNLLGFAVGGEDVHSVSVVLSSYKIQATVLEEFLFIGVFESVINNKQATDQIESLVSGLATTFIRIYPPELRLKNPVRSNDFIGFTEEIISRAESVVTIRQCKNCFECGNKPSSCIPKLIMGTQAR